ncbi:hypothetical protein BDF20DRAFT_882709 [Mycotypha africana]|uniref:uncharacterized protein n=1 Tax=Mycotypha africana TaxID=64632 RepID=UPI0023017D18|nr:uncharacterized protein BDF20DRAFT_882709 [Mycotypha africana]KAI8973499.1 hypothetical protein BDF20DRAFT_882709 [Mycotypha africana]
MLFHARNPTTTMLNIESQKEQQHQLCQDGTLKINQRLNSAQYHYEFPPRSHNITFNTTESDSSQYFVLDEDELFSYDGHSLTSASTETFTHTFHDKTSHPQQQQQYYRDTMSPLDKTEQLLDQYLDILTLSNDSIHETQQMADHFLTVDEELSPLQLPSRAIEMNGQFPSFDSMSTINRKVSLHACPSSFLDTTWDAQYQFKFIDQKEEMIHWDTTSYVFPDYISPSSASEYLNGYQSVHPYYCVPERLGYIQDDLLSYRCEEEDEESDGEEYSDEDTKVVLIKFSKKRKTQSQTTSIRNMSLYYVNNDDDDDKNNNKPLEAVSTFVALDCVENTVVRHQANRNYDESAAAIKIQSLWRGYQCRKKRITSNQVLQILARINNSMDKRKVNQLHARIDRLEKHLQEETAMRIAFENAMEDMAAQVDQQNHFLEERMHQMQQNFTVNTELLMSQIESMNAVLRENSESKAKLESKLSEALQQIDDLKLQVKRESEQKQNIRQQLKKTLDEITLLKSMTKKDEKQSNSPVVVRKVTAIERNRNVVTTSPTSVKSKNQPLHLKTQTAPQYASRKTATASISMSFQPVKNARSTDANSKTSKPPTTKSLTNVRGSLNRTIKSTPKITQAISVR